MQNDENGTPPPPTKAMLQLGQISWDFEGEQSRSGFSSLHFHPGRFISQLPSVLISLFTKVGDVVLDPYCGSGTTLVEAQRLNRKAIGIDVNPVSVMISEAKTLDMASDEVLDVLRGLQSSLFSDLSLSDVPVPETVQLEKWYSADVASALVRLYKSVHQTTEHRAKCIKTFCFSSILLSVSRETRHWGYVCDNTAPRDNPRRNVRDELSKAVDRIVSSFRERERLNGASVISPLIFNASAQSLLGLLDPESVDLVVTSPPYQGVVDYIKAQRLTMEWLALDIETYRIRETGARSKRHRISADAEFESEIESTFFGLHRVLKPHKYCAVVFGASAKRKFGVSRLIEVAERTGFRHVQSAERQISIRRNLNPSLMSEEILLFVKNTS